ncbi:MAG TPA: hypothetical protein PLG22_07265 [Kiritimatiellia bacterium]|nr:hypothetical protein [Kiritimatiellia bacterium]
MGKQKKIPSGQPQYEWRVFDPEIRMYLLAEPQAEPMACRRALDIRWQKDYETASRFTEVQATEIATVINLLYTRAGWVHDRLDIVNRSL